MRWVFSDDMVPVSILRTPYFHVFKLHGAYFNVLILRWAYFHAVGCVFSNCWCGAHLLRLLSSAVFFVSSRLFHGTAWLSSALLRLFPSLSGSSRLFSALPVSLWLFCVDIAVISLFTTDFPSDQISNIIKKNMQLRSLQMVANHLLTLLHLSE